MIEPVSLGTWPTPLEPAPRLAARLGLAELWFKRDDLNGLGGGGNKIRKLQYTCAEALASGADTVVTSGAPQSNHARLTAAAAARLGLSCVLVLDGPPVEERRGNLLLDELAGAEIVWADGRPREEVLAAEAEKRSAHVIPFGGSSPRRSRATSTAAGSCAPGCRTSTRRRSARATAPSPRTCGRRW